jgi:amino acid adenylation domain-containing protein
MALYNLLRRLYQLLSTTRQSNNNRHVARTLIAKHTQDFYDGFQKHVDGLYYSKQRLQQVRNERLRTLLIHAKSNSPWYKKTLAHIDVEHFTEERLNELPTINKSILMENWDAIVTDRNLTLELIEKHLKEKTDSIDALYLFDRYHVVSTGATSGKRGIFIFDWDEWLTYYTNFVRYPSYNHERTEPLLTRPQNLKIAYFFTKNITFTAFAFLKSFHVDNAKRYCFSMTAPLDQICAMLNKVQPDVLTSMPSFIYKLSQEAIAGKLKIQPTIIYVGAETHYEQFQHNIQKAWPNVHVFNTYSSTEGVIAKNCRANHDEMHLNDDFCIVEPVDANNNPVTKGVLSNKQFITNLYNYTLPLIRYESSDQLLFLNKDCDCGIQHQLIVSPGGRSEFDFIYSNNLIIKHSLFVRLLLADKNIQEYQVIQTKNGADIKLLTKGLVDKIKLQETITKHLNQAGLDKPIINIIEVKQFDYLLSGKLKRFLKLKQDELQSIKSTMSDHHFETIVTQFEEKVTLYPENTAVYLEDRQISYDALNKQVNQYARYLQRKGLSANEIVGIHMMRSFEMLIAIFAVLKAGGAFLPLDPSAPISRNQHFLHEGQVHFVIVDEDSFASAKKSYAIENLQLLNIHDDLSGESSENLNLHQDKGDLAYVMYTSGSTGSPKGVMISHSALFNRIQWMQLTFPLQSTDVLFQKTHVCFDVSVWEMFWWSIAGAGVVLLPPLREHDIKLFVQMIERYKISAIHFVPSVFHIFLNYIKDDFSIQRLQSLKYVFSSGETLDAKSVNLFNQLFQHYKTQLVNLYGPTEATIDVSYFICEKQKKYHSIPIGKAIQNIQLFVLDEHLNDTGSEPGELFISGAGLAKGYLNNPQLTHASFVDNPFLPGEKMYRTGDFVRWNNEQELMFIGRKDNQVKLHGMRIELEEVQHHLLDHPSIKDAFIVCEKIDSLDNRLVAYLIPNNKEITIDGSVIKAFLKERIPSYMIPEHYVWLAAFPIKANGKIDKEKLTD